MIQFSSNTFFFEYPWCEAKGKSFEDYIAQHQDSARNALQKSHEAAFLAWHEELRADQAQFTSDRILKHGFV